MALWRESESILCSCSLLLTNFRRTCVRKPTNSLGRIIKDLNKENRTLFGKLIETRKERRKNVLSIPLSTGGDVLESQQNLFPETVNVVTAQNSSTDLWPRAEIRVIKSNSTRCKKNTKLSSTSVTNVNESVQTYSEELVNKGISSGEVFEPKSDSPDLSSSNQLSEKYTNVLPLIVLKSIEKYPMMNHGKNIATTYSLKDFDNSCITNKQISRLYPSVTKVLNATMSEHSKMLLKKWRERMIAELGQDGFMSFYKAQLNSGSQFHAAIQSFLRGAHADELLLDGKGVEGCWKSLTPVILDMKHVQILEGPVCHSSLLYHGVLDCVAQYQGKHVLIEWKKSDKPKPTIEKTYDAPIQLSAYIGAMNFDRNYPIQIEGGMVVVAYSDGSPAETFHLDLPQCYWYWKLWLQRLKSFWNQYYESQSAKSNT